MKTLSSMLATFIFLAFAARADACYTSGEDKFCIGDTVHHLVNLGETLGRIKEILSNGDLLVDYIWVNANSVSPEVKCIGNICKDTCVFYSHNREGKARGSVQRLFKNGRIYVRDDQTGYSTWRDIKELATAVDCHKRPKPST